MTNNKIKTVLCYWKATHPTKMLRLYKHAEENGIDNSGNQSQKEFQIQCQEKEGVHFNAT